MKLSRNLLLLSASILSVTTLTGCQKDNSKIYLYEKNSCISTGDFSNGRYKKLATYRHKDYGEVPYCNFKDLIKAGAFLKGTSINYSGDGEFNVVYQKDGVTTQLMTLNTESDEMVIQNFDLLVKVFEPSENNGIPFEQCGVLDDDVHLVHTSTNSIQVGEPVVETYDLSKYSIDMINKNKNLYIPTQFILDFLCRNLGATFAYNGLDFIAPGQFAMDNYGSYCSFYTSKNHFYYRDKLMAPSETVGDEKYRYIYDDNGFEPAERRYLIISLTKNGYGYITHLPTPTTPVNISNIDFSLRWSKQDIGLLVMMYSNGVLRTTFKITSKETNLNKVIRSESVIKFAYSMLRFQFNEIYGLMDELHAKQGVDNVDDLITLSGLKQDLMSPDSFTYEAALTKFIETYVDDGHTYLYQKPIYTRFSGPTKDELFLQNLGPRSEALRHKRDEEYKIERAEKLNSGEENFTPDYRWDYNGQGLYIKGNTAIIRFDGFIHDNTLIHRYQPYNFDNPGYEFDVFYPRRQYASCVRGMDMCFNEIRANHSEVKNVVIDLTCNTGGQIVTLPYLVAFFSEDPTLIEYDRVLKVRREYHYKVDLNHDGIYGGEGDSYANVFDNMAILTSDLSFSCGSALPSMAKIAGIKTIGAKSAGGACPPTLLTDGCGGSYSTSAPMQISYFKDGQLINDDAGVDPDILIEKVDWFNFAVINGLFNE